MAEEERAPMTTAGEAARLLTWEEITKLRPFEWLMTARPSVTRFEGRLSILRYPWGRVEAFDHRTGVFALLRKGDAFPFAGEVWRSYKPSAEKVATSLIGDLKAGPIVFVRRSLSVEAPATAQEALLDKRLWEIFTRVNACVTNIGRAGLLIDDRGNLRLLVDSPPNEGTGPVRGAFPADSLGPVVH